MIDNYDSFTYNLVHYIGQLTGVQPDVVRNDEIALEAVAAWDKIVLSPGPGIPSEAGICLDLIRRYAPEKSILGVCLGHQAIGEVFGGQLHNLSSVFHGLATPVSVTDQEEILFKGLPHTFQAGRYHSWVVRAEGLPDCLQVTCLDEQGMVMGLRHKTYDVRGLQFHPESVLTEHGMSIISNWLTASQPHSLIASQPIS